MLASDDVTIAAHTTLPPDDVLEAAGDAYRAAFAEAPYLETPEERAGFIERVRGYASRDGFRLAGSPDGAAPAPGQCRVFSSESRAETSASSSSLSRSANC
jgi:hypothetical protein